MTPWLFGPLLDVAVFGGSAALGLVFVALRRVLGWPGELPEWGFLAFVVGVDVAHVYATLFRTYFDRAELRRHPVRYAAVPVVAYVAGVALHLQSSHAFWRVLAYLAVFHFVRQQAGWMALYRARSGITGGLDRVLDGAAIYAGTGYPLVYWHAHLGDARFAWFIEGDFANVVTAAAFVLPAARALWVVALLAFAIRQAALLATGGGPAWGRVLVATTTAAVWYVGIVATNSDFDFTVTNVLTHGVPYFAFVFAHVRAQRRAGAGSLGTEIAAHGFGAFAGVLLAIAFVEEAVWDRLVWHDRSWLFGQGVALSVLASALVVPLLAVPQATHYLLDGLVWRRTEAGMAWLRRG